RRRRGLGRRHHSGDPGQRRRAVPDARRRQELGQVGDNPMARAVSTRTKIGWTVAAWAVALLLFFPILYTIVTSFKSETEAIAGFSLIPSGTLESYAEVQSQYNYFKPFMNSVIIS